MAKVPVAVGAVVVALLGTLAWTAAPAPAAPPSSVTLAGSLQSELGCAGAWDPGCVTTRLTRAPDVPVWRATFAVPAGAYEYRLALDGGWAVSYPVGGNRALFLPAGRNVRFYFDETNQWIADSANDVIATLSGSFQSELGCTTDWDPGCLRTLLRDLDGDGVSSFTTTSLPPGPFELLVAHDEDWSVHYGAGGIRNGDTIAFTVPAAGAAITFSYDEASHVLTISRPDARIRHGTGPEVGNDVYGTLTGQTRRGSTGAGQSVRFSVSVESDAAGGERFRLSGQGSTPRFGVVYRDPAGVDITARVRTGTYRTPSLPPGTRHRISAIVTVRSGAPRAASLARTVAAISTLQPHIRDTVRFITTRR